MRESFLKASDFHAQNLLQLSMYYLPAFSYSLYRSLSPCASIPLPPSVPLAAVSIRVVS